MTADTANDSGPGEAKSDRPAELLHIGSDGDLRPLIESHHGEHGERVSIYVPVDRSPTDLHASRLRARASVDRAAERLRERGVSADEVDARIAHLDAVWPELRSLDASTHSQVWLGDARRWALAALTPSLEERVVVGEHYALRPLLRALARDQRFRVLAVSANRVAAFEGDDAGLEPVELPGVPASLEDALGAEVEGRELLFRSDQPVPGQRANAPIFHGHGGAADARSIDRERYHRILGPAISSLWRDSDLPVVLAAEQRTATELRGQLELSTLLAEDVRGTPDHWSVGELHTRALPVVRASLEARESELRERYEQARNSGKAIEGGVDAVAQAAIAGRIRRLWIEEEAHLPGRIDDQSGLLIETKDPNDDALDALVSWVLVRSGEVRVVD
ncbi:MAG TPA: hypothetical protein ENO23_09230, partial [Alphaproteobacteria bacterium]|nr:hypothetical protein [Alphaproteobacteria bacterium]